MEDKRRNLYGNAPDKCPLAILVIDVVNDFEFEQAERLYEFALPMADRLSKFLTRARQSRIPIIYVNDNFGRWRSDFTAQVQHCLQDGVLGEPIVRMLQPQQEDYFVLKPAHSGFYCSALELMLKHLEVKTVILTGLATNVCLMFTANDAYIRGLQIFVPADCAAAMTAEDHTYAIQQMSTTLKASVDLSTEIDFEKLLHSSGDAFTPQS